MLSAFHRINCHIHVSLPVRTDVHEVNVVPLAELLPAILSRVLGSGRFAPPGKNLLRLGDSVSLQVTESHDLGTVNISKTSDRIRSPHSQTYESGAHSVNRICCKQKHILLPLGRSRLVKHDYAILDPISVT